jgi:hypothetical protein
MPLYSATCPLPVNRIKNRLFDPDARDYILRVEAADGQRLESQVRGAINAFVIGCKADGIWTALKASCIMAGARTLSGALIPLVGTAPTNNNFVSGDYNRKTGLLGNGTNKSLNANRNSNADPLTNKHLSVYCTTGNTRDVARAVIATATGNNQGSSQIFTNSTALNVRVSYSTAPTSFTVSGLINGFIGGSRNNSSTYDYYFNNALGSQSNASSIFFASQNTFVFATSTPSLYSDARIAFYSIGTSIDLSMLNSRTTTLMNTLASVIA